MFEVILVIDNELGYHIDLSHTNVEVIFLPTNMPSLIQLLDNGVIATHKACTKLSSLYFGGNRRF